MYIRSPKFIKKLSIFVWWNETGQISWNYISKTSFLIRSSLIVIIIIYWFGTKETTLPPTTTPTHPPSVSGTFPDVSLVSYFCVKNRPKKTSSPSSVIVSDHPPPLNQSLLWYEGNDKPTDTPTPHSIQPTVKCSWEGDGRWFYFWWYHPFISLTQWLKWLDGMKLIAAFGATTLLHPSDRPRIWRCLHHIMHHIETLEKRKIWKRKRKITSAHTTLRCPCSRKVILILILGH